MWFHVQEYEAVVEKESVHPDVWANLACCYFMLGMYAEANSAAEKGVRSALSLREGVVCNN